LFDPCRRALLLAGFILVLPVADAVYAQQMCSDTMRLASTDLASVDRDIGRTLQLAGAMAPAPALLRRGSRESALDVCADSVAAMAWLLRPRPVMSARPYVTLLPAVFELQSNSQYRRDINNGALRGGVGASTAIGAGAAVAWRGFTLAVQPRIIRDANHHFETLEVHRTGYSPWSTRWRADIDFPQRFGAEGSVRIDPGQSYLRFGTGRFEAGIATENVWLGAQQSFPILISATAPGYLHAFAGTVEPIDIWIGKLGAHVSWGRLDESDHFDQDPENDRRLFAVSLLEFAPRWVPGLNLGVARVHHENIPPEGLSAGEWLSSAVVTGFTWRAGANRPGNSIGALLARWVFPAAGFEAWLEWSREDTPHDIWDLIDQPDWTQAYAVGFQQLVTLPHVRLRWYGELVHLGEAAPVRAGKGFFSYYTHGVVIQGHTHDGQILGAAPGPGSDAQVVGVDGFHRFGMSGVWLERTRYDDDTYYRAFARMWGESRHDVEIGAGVRHAMRAGPLLINGELLYNRRANRGFIGLSEWQGPRLVERNVGVRLRAVWRP
jgi:hypothetical protein